MALLPIHLPEGELVNILQAFVGRNRHILNRMVFDKRYIVNPSFLRQVTNELVGEVVGRAMDLYRDGEIDTGEASFYRFSSESDGSDFPYKDDEDDEEGDLDTL